MRKIYLKIALFIFGFSLCLGKTLEAQNCWQALSSGVGISPASNNISCITVYSGHLYAGGSFAIAGGNTVLNIAMWDGSNWSALGSGIPTDIYNGTVNTLAVFNGELYVGGHFDTAGGLPANNIAKWNGSSWSTANSGLGGTGISSYDHNISALAEYNGALYAIGSFDTANGFPVNNIAKWNGTSWSDVGGGIGGEVLSLTVASGKLYVGGEFSLVVGTDTAIDIAAWNDTAWSALGGGIGVAYDDQVEAIAEYNGLLYVGGTQLNTASGIPINNIAKWNGTSWSDVDGGFGIGSDAYVAALTVYDGKLLAGGSFTLAGATTVSNLAQWNGVSWSDFGGGVSGGYQTVGAMDTFNGNLYIGGLFNQAGNTNALNIAEWTCATGISEIATNNLVNIFPNPSNGFINISVQSISNMPQIELYNLMGDRIYHTTLNAETTQLDLSKKAAGTYFYRINDGEGANIGSGEFIIQ